jgi:excisionase family DNA binding protein
LADPEFSRIFYGEMTERRSMTDDIWTIKELAAYLRLKEKTAYALVAKGEIPGFKVGGSWRFRRSDIERWIEESKNN